MISDGSKDTIDGVEARLGNAITVGPTVRLIFASPSGGANNPLNK